MGGKLTMERMKIKGTIVNNELFISSKDVMSYLEDVIKIDLSNPKKENTPFARKLLKILQRYEKSIDTK